MRYVIAIDVGIKNLGMCVFDFVTCDFVFWDNISLVPTGRYQPSENVKYVRNFAERYRQFFEDAHAIVVERQMRCNMRIVEALLQSMFYERCVIINARSVKLHYGLSMNNYRLNKQKAVEWATEFTRNNASSFANKCDHNFTSQSKKDDLADSLLLATYYLDTYSNQLTSVEANNDGLFV